MSIFIGSVWRAFYENALLKELAQLKTPYTPLKSLPIEPFFADIRQYVLIPFKTG